MPKLENSNATFLVIFKHCAQVKILTKKSHCKGAVRKQIKRVILVRIKLVSVKLERVN